MGGSRARRIARAVGSAAAGLVITLATGAVPVYTGPEDPAIGASTWSGLPVPFRQNAPGLNIYGWWHHTFWLDLAIWAGVVYWLLARRQARQTKG